MNPHEAILLSIDMSSTSRIGLVSVRGALIRVRLDLVPDVAIGDVLLVDAGVAVAIIPPKGTKESAHPQRTSQHVPGHTW